MKRIEKQQLAASEEFTSEKKEWQRELVCKLVEEFPEANVRQDEGYFIYDLWTASGTLVHAYVPKWECIPVIVGRGEEGVLFRTEQFIRAELRWRKEFGDDYTVLDALRMEGLVREKI